MKACSLVSGLHLMVPLHGLRVGWWNSSLVTGSSTWPSVSSTTTRSTIPSSILWLMNRRSEWCCSSISWRLSLSLGNSSLFTVWTLHNYVCNSVGLSVLRDAFVILFGIFGYNVPCVQETRKEAKYTETYVDERIGRADTRFDPDYLKFRNWSIWDSISML